LNANEVIGNAKKILANGSTVVSAGTERNDGQGGGGAGGTIFIKANSVSGIVAEARGGDGGDCLFYVNSQIIGPGGGGGGGKMLISQPTLGFISSLSGGNNGIANQNLTNGAKPGDSGSLVPNSKLVEATDSATATYINVALSLCPDETVVLAGQTYSAPDTLQLFLAGQNDDCDTIATYTLSLKDAPLNMPNAFTPNGDGKNDLFRPVTHKGSDFAAISLEIYSRWGEKLHTSTGPNAQWDGNIKDSAAPSDIYVWVLYYEDCTGAVQKIHGQITLLR
jgi:gliding motility-associated-like protein